MNDNNFVYPATSKLIIMLNTENKKKFFLSSR